MYCSRDTSVLTDTQPVHIPPLKKHNASCLFWPHFFSLEICVRKQPAVFFTVADKLTLFSIYFMLSFYSSSGKKWDFVFLLKEQKISLCLNSDSNYVSNSIWSFLWNTSGWVTCFLVFFFLLHFSTCKVGRIMLPYMHLSGIWKIVRITIS